MRRARNICEDFLLFDLQRAQNDTMRLKTLLASASTAASPIQPQTHTSVR